MFPNRALAMLDVFYRAGAPVLRGARGGALLQAEAMPAEWDSSEPSRQVLRGAGGPSPLFTFGALSGTSMN